VIKLFRAETYSTIFDTETGFEVIQGIDGHPDPFRLDFPCMIDCGIMGHCHNECYFCYQGDKNEPNMELKNYKRIIDEGKPFVNQIALGGRGDPNKHKNFKEIVEYSVKNVVVPNYTTSGRCLTKDEVEISKLCGAVAVSDYRQEYTYLALEALMDAGIKTNIHFLFSASSFIRVLRILKGEDIWRGRVDIDRLNAVIFLLFKPQGRAVKLSHWQVDDRMVSHFITLARKGLCKFKIGMDSCLVNKVNKVSRLTEEEKLYLDSCESGRMSVYITPNMKLVPCSFADSNIHGLSLHDHNIKTCWELGRPFQKVREKLSKNPTTCPYGL